MRRVNIKIGLVIIIYSIILTLILTLGVYGFKNSYNKSAEKKIIDNTILYKIDTKDYKNILSSNSLNVSISNIAPAKEISNYYETVGFKNLTPFLIKFFIILIISSFLLWAILNSIHNKEIKIITKNLNTLDKDMGLNTLNNSISLAYNNIKNKFNENLDDYKRLNSYLSHEQKNAIAILRTNLEIDENYKYLKFIDNISHSIDDILTLSDSKIPKDMTAVDVSLVCASICDTYSNIYKNISFDFDYESNTTILAKERWIYRAISNLVDNAIKYGQGNPIDVYVKNKNNSVIITVKDNGIGIDKKSIEQIFNNKYRINKLNKAGYGIGLSLVSHVCDLCEGFVMVDSELNKGSCFYLSFLEYK